MTPEAQRVAIAEACGWKHRLATHDAPVERCGMKLPNSFGHPIEAWWHETNEQHRGVYAVPPNYPEDLNKMHEAISTLPSDGSWTRFLCELENVTNCAGQPASTYNFIMVNARAEQRAEAFLRTIGKWRDEP